jgi:hypothetical protein
LFIENTTLVDKGVSLTDLAVLPGMADAGRPEMADADRAREVAIRALDALNDRGETESADPVVGYLSNALESVIFELRAGA